MKLLSNDVSLLIQDFIPVEDQISMIGFSKCMTLQTLRLLWQNLLIEEKDDPRIDLVLKRTGVFEYNEFVRNIGYNIDVDSFYKDIDFLGCCPNLTHLGLNLNCTMDSKWVPKLQYNCKKLKFLAILGCEIDLDLIQEWPTLEFLIFDKVPLNFGKINLLDNLHTLVIKNLNETILCDHVFPNITELSFKQSPSRSKEFIARLAKMFPNLKKFEFAGAIENDEADESCINLTPFKQLQAVKLMGEFIGNDTITEINILSFDFHHPLERKKYENLEHIQLNWVLIHHNQIHLALYRTISLLQKQSFSYDLNFMNGLAIKGPAPKDSPEVYQNADMVIVKCIPNDFVIILSREIAVLSKREFVLGIAEFLSLIGVNDKVNALCMLMLERFVVETFDDESDELEEEILLNEDADEYFQ